MRHSRDLGVRAALIGGARRLSDDELYEMCLLNRDLRIERTADGEILIMPPSGGETGRRIASLTAQLGRWAEQDGTGVSFDSSTGFILPSGAQRSPDAAWITLPRWQALAAEARAKFPPLCPDFVVELRSRTDDLTELQAKMDDYRACGARLSWLIDPTTRRVYVYRPDRAVEVLDAPATLSGEAVLRGLTMDLTRIW